MAREPLDVLPADQPSARVIKGCGVNHAFPMLRIANVMTHDLIIDASLSRCHSQPSKP